MRGSTDGSLPRLRGTRAQTWSLQPEPNFNTQRRKLENLYNENSSPPEFRACLKQLLLTLTALRLTFLRGPQGGNVPENWLTLLPRAPANSSTPNNYLCISILLIGRPLRKRQLQTRSDIAPERLILCKSNNVLHIVPQRLLKTQALPVERKLRTSNLNKPSRP